MTILAGRTAVDAAREIATALEVADVPYAIGGALALGVAGVPRGTKDVDLNVFVDLDRVSFVVEVLRAIGIAFDAEAALAQAATSGMFIGSWDGMVIDVFVPSIPFADEAGRTSIVVRDGEWSGRFLSAESIAVFKLLFFRLKDRSDLQRLVAVRGSAFDHAYVRRWIVDMMGDDDERVRAWDEIVASASR